jgi:hypothetical protein
VPRSRIFMHEVVVVALRLVHPQHVVEQQFGGVAGGQALVRQAGRQTITVRSLPTSLWTPKVCMLVS